jgi:hypothetical protein
VCRQKRKSPLNRRGPQLPQPAQPTAPLNLEAGSCSPLVQKPRSWLLPRVPGGWVGGPAARPLEQIVGKCSRPCAVPRFCSYFIIACCSEPPNALRRPENNVGRQASPVRERTPHRTSDTIGNPHLLETDNRSAEKHTNHTKHTTLPPCTRRPVSSPLAQLGGGIITEIRLPAPLVSPTSHPALRIFTRIAPYWDNPLSLTSAESSLRFPVSCYSKPVSRVFRPPYPRPRVWTIPYNTDDCCVRWRGSVATPVSDISTAWNSVLQSCNPRTPISLSDPGNWIPSHSFYYLEPLHRVMLHRITSAATT